MRKYFIFFLLLAGSMAVKAQNYFQFSLGTGSAPNVINVYVKPNHNNPNPAVNYIGQWNLGIQIPASVASGVSATLAVNPTGLWSTASVVGAATPANDGTFRTFSWNGLLSSSTPTNWTSGTEYMVATITFSGGQATNQVRLIDMSNDPARYGGNTDNALVVTTVLGLGGYDATPASYSAAPFYSRSSTTIATDGSGNPVSTLGVLVSLPVRLLSFIATETNCKVSLNWKTADEVNTSHFDVEYSADGLHFNTIAKVTAQGTGNGRDYATELTQNTQVGYYRLKMVDNDGAYRYSPVRSLQTNCLKSDQVKIFPNPVTNSNGTVTVSLTTSYRGTAQYRMVNEAGQQILTKQVQITGDANIQQFNMTALAQGVYYLRVIGKDGTDICKPQQVIKN